MTRSDILILNGDDFLSAWHYPPTVDDLTKDARAPIVIMAHGYSLTKDCGLEDYALKFAQAGMHVLVFDYRNFGQSSGKHRDVVNTKMQLEDYQAALRFARAMPQVDKKRIALSGTSFSGGLVIAVAAMDQGIRALVSQVPNLDNLATLKFLIKQNSPKRFAWLLGQVFRDVGHALIGRKPHCVRSVGPVGSQSAYESDDDWRKAQSIVSQAWTNRVNCPVQFFGCD